MSDDKEWTGTDDGPIEGPDDRKESGPQIIARILKTLPNSPGVYRMLDENSDVLYVGKARSLKKRVHSYTRLGGHTNRVARMIAATRDMEFVTTKTESEALLLEANLIKRLKPRFNVLLRDDKSFPYILVAQDHEAPQILKHRGSRKRKGEYFGPFASAGAVNNTINTLQRAFLLRTCSDATYESRVRPCLLYQIKRCSGPCTGEISIDAYKGLVHEATKFLRGKSKDVQTELNRLMEEASDKLEFEMAAEYRNRLWALAHVQQHQDINPATIEEADVIAAHQDAGQTCVQVFFFRTGQNWGNRAYYPRADKSFDASEVLESFIAQFYDDKPVPRQILLSHDVPGRSLLSDALSTKADRKVEVLVPRRGEKRKIVAHAEANARQALGRRLAESASQLKLLEGVAKVFDLDETPRRIEVYDNSHIQGQHAVGGMIVAGAEGFSKNQYRKFNIKSEELTPGDDYAMMREVLTRRFSRLLKEHSNERAPIETGSESVDLGDVGDQHPDVAQASDVDEENGQAQLEKLNDELPVWPDLILIDGGAGQLSAALSVLDELGVNDVAVVSIAKGPDRNAGRERFFMAGRQPFMLQPRDPVLYFTQRLRDEAHRFAIGAHRAKRKKAVGRNQLDEVPGVGPGRKRALLKHFGSAKAVSRAGLADLKDVDGISAAMAQTIYDYFHE